MGMVFSSSSVCEEGTTLTREQRTSNRDEKGYASVNATVLSSLASMVSSHEKNPPMFVSTRQASNALTTSAATTSVPSEYLAPSRRVTS